MSEAMEGITSYCYQVCGSYGSAMCGTGKVCQFGIDIETQMPADVEEAPFVGPLMTEELYLLHAFRKRAKFFEANDALAGVGVAGAIGAMMPHWEIQVREGAGRKELISDLRKLIEKLDYFIMLEECDF